MCDARPTCYECFRPRAICICGVLTRVPNRTRITIVQHPRERFHPLNTARIAEGSLERVQVLRGELSGLNAQLEAGAISQDALLLYPSADAVDLGELPDGEPAREVVILDGTWHHASTLLRDLPFLRRLRCARFTPPAPSEYQIRKEPRADYLSTIESIAHVLNLLEPETEGLGTLRDAFLEMIRRNLAARRPEPNRRTAQREKRPYVFPEGLGEPLSQVVLAYAEGAHLERRRGGGVGVRHPLLVNLFWPDTQRSQTVLLRPPQSVRQRLLEELQLAEHALERQGRSLVEARTELSELVEGRLVVAWNASSFGLLADLGIELRRKLFLKSIYCDWRRSLGDRPEAWGGMGEILRQRGLPAVSEPGRAARRLRQTAALFDYLRDQATLPSA